MSQTISAAPVPPAPPPSRRSDTIRDDAHARAVAEGLAQDFAAGAADRDRDRRLPWAELDRFSASGLWGITVPKDLGGPGVSVETLVQVIVTIGEADGSLSQIPQNHFYALEALRVGGTPEQNRFFAERVLAGERFGNALAEIGHKDFKRRTRLDRTSSGWFVEGRKFYCTGAIFAHWIPTLVASDEDGRQVLYLAFVPRNAKGVIVIDDWDGFGQRVTGSGSVTFDRVRVEPEWVVPFTASFERPTTIGPFAQILHAAIDLGIGLGAYRETLRFVRERSRPWIDACVERASDDPLIIHAVGDVHVRLRAAQAVMRRAARSIAEAQADSTDDSVARASVAVAQARILTTEAGLLASSKLFELAGSSSTDEAEALDRHWRNVRTHTLHDPVRWKYQAVGNFVLNGRRPPRHGAI
ncbi:MAG: SfnB family sulfur acquisition oxidoreductase [Rhizobiaceae bacterium]|nr:SfnB family sulfur acquisition oxidoreductase [Rhizobiaceae bacterium]